MMYASRTGTRRNLAALRAAGWRLLLSPAGVLRTEGFAHYALDNGAWAAHQRGTVLDGPKFADAVSRFGAAADWVVVPDVVGNRKVTLVLAEHWVPRLVGRCPMLLLAVQDGMTEADVRGWLSSSIGLFLGGSTEWKLTTMREWGRIARTYGCHYHVARVNSIRRISMAAEAGADSVDGSSVTRYAVTLPKLDRASRQGAFRW